LVAVLPDDAPLLAADAFAKIGHTLAAFCGISRVARPTEGAVDVRSRLGSRDFGLVGDQRFGGRLLEMRIVWHWRLTGEAFFGRAGVARATIGAGPL
jgi:hypothetical protein